MKQRFSIVLLIIANRDWNAQRISSTLVSGVHGFFHSFNPLFGEQYEKKTKKNKKNISN